MLDCSCYSGSMCLIVLWETNDSSASAQAGPRCATKNFTPLLEKRRGDLTYITGDFQTGAWIL